MPRNSHKWKLKVLLKKTTTFEHYNLTNYLMWKLFSHGTKRKKVRQFFMSNCCIFCFCKSILYKFSKFNNILWGCRFCSKNLSNFVSLDLKLHNWYCHIVDSLHWMSYFLLLFPRNQSAMPSDKVNKSIFVPGIPRLLPTWNSTYICTYVLDIFCINKYEKHCQGRIKSLQEY